MPSCAWTKRQAINKKSWVFEYMSEAHVYTILFNRKLIKGFGKLTQYCLEEQIHYKYAVFSIKSQRFTRF